MNWLSSRGLLVWWTTWDRSGWWRGWGTIPGLASPARGAGYRLDIPGKENYVFVYDVLLISVKRSDFLKL